MHERNVTVVESGNGPFGQFITTGHHVLGADEPSSLGGKDTGPDPYELVLAGLGACTAMTIRMYAQRKQIPLTRVEVRLRHVQRMSSEVLKDRFERAITLVGNLTSEQRQHLLEIAERCPVSKTLRQSSDIASLLADARPDAVSVD
jgi:putative redox protein